MKIQNKILENVKKVNELEEGIFFDKKPKLKGRDITKDKYYQRQIVTKLFPMLKSYGINMLNTPLKTTPSTLKYIGRDEKDTKVSLLFMNNNEEVNNYSEGKDSMLVYVTYNYKEKEAGIVDLSTDEGVENAFSLITMTIEDISNSNAEKPKEKEDNKKSNIEDYSKDLDNLVNFKNSR